MSLKAARVDAALPSAWSEQRWRSDTARPVSSVDSTPCPFGVPASVLCGAASDTVAVAAAAKNAAQILSPGVRGIDALATVTTALRDRGPRRTSTCLCSLHVLTLSEKEIRNLEASVAISH
jgi:hypothetical protein